jgi:diguanylate cyclase (GGDEF)-like protein
MVDRRRVHMVRWVREERERIANKMAAQGTLLGGGFVTTVGGAFRTGFAEFTKGITIDGLTVVRESFGGRVTPELVHALRQELEAYFDQAAETLLREVGESGPMKREIPEVVHRVLEGSVPEAKRDLAIEMDLVALKNEQRAPVVDEALLDALVSLQNRRGLEIEFPKHTQDTNEHLCLALFDIDHFKDVNDKKGGHAVGDEALKSIAEVASRSAKGKGSAFRWGGDEFVILLPNHELDEALPVAERFRRDVHSTPHTSQQLTLSVSVGVAEWPTHGATLDELEKAADRALYDAKKRGRNLVRFFGEPEPMTAPRELGRKQPQPGALSDDEAQSIREDYSRSGSACCPRDEAMLRVQNVTTFGEARDSLLVSCPLCGLTATLE